MCFSILGELIMISTTAQRPEPSEVSIRFIETIARRTIESWERTCACCSCGQESMMRSIDWAALLVWSVEKTRWPVSAAVIAVCIVFQSRISPTMITSGSCRNMFFRASLKLGESVETSRWETAAFPSAKRNSIGSSIVTMWTGRFSMIERMMPASVVDLPEPVGPVIENEALGQVDEALEDLGQVQLGDRRELERDAPEDGGIGAALDEDVAAEAGDAGQPVADVDGLVALEPLLLGGRQDRRGASPRGPWAAKRLRSKGSAAP